MYYDYKVVPKSGKSVNFQCVVTEIHFDTQNLDNPNAGYFIKFETLTEKQSGTAKIAKNIKQGSFQFSFDPIYRRFQRELRDRENKDILTDKNF